MRLVTGIILLISLLVLSHCNNEDQDPCTEVTPVFSMDSLRLLIANSSGPMIDTIAYNDLILGLNIFFDTIISGCDDPGDSRDAEVIESIISMELTSTSAYNEGHPARSNLLGTVAQFFPFADPIESQCLDEDCVAGFLLPPDRSLPHLFSLSLTLDDGRVLEGNTGPVVITP